MRPRVDPSTIVLVVLALVLAAVAYLKDPGLPLIGAKNGFSMLRFILPRLVPALMLAGLMQVLIPEAVISRHFGRAGGLRAILMATVAGVLTPGGPMVSVPFMVALANSGAALPSLVAYMTSWSLFGVQRIIAWEAPLMGWHFVVVRVIPSLAFPIVAGWLVAVFYRECARSATSGGPSPPPHRPGASARRPSPPCAASRPRPSPHASLRPPPK